MFLSSLSQYLSQLSSLSPFSSLPPTMPSFPLCPSELFTPRTFTPNAILPWASHLVKVLYDSIGLLGEVRVYGGDGSLLSLACGQQRLTLRYQHVHRALRAHHHSPDLDCTWRVLDWKGLMIVVRLVSCKRLLDGWMVMIRRNMEII